MLVDTSAWVEIFRPKSNVYQTLFRHHISDGELIYTCPVIVQEVLQGVLPKDYWRVKVALQSAILLSFPDTFRMAVGAADLYRQCRKKGVTVRKSPDCLIAYYAIQYKLPLLHRDNDFNNIAKVHALQIVAV